MSCKTQKTLYLTENITAENGTDEIHVPPPMLLVRIPADYTGQVILNYNQGRIGNVEKVWKERYKPVELSDRGFRSGSA